MKMFKGVKIKKALRKLKNQPTDEAFLKLLREKLVSYVEKTPFVRNEREESLYFQRFSPLFNVFNAKMFKTMPIAIILGLIGIGASAATVAASQNSLPGDTLYPVKILSEDARLAVIFNDESETKARMNLAQRRVEEISELITEAKLNTSITGEQIGKLELSLNKALDNFNSHLDIVSVKANEFQDKGESEKAFKTKEELKAAVSAYRESINLKDGRDDKLGEEIRKIVRSVDDSEEKIRSKVHDIDEDEDNRARSAGIAVSAQGKIKAAQNKINSTENFINRISEKFGTSTVASAKEKLEIAKTLFLSAKSDYDSGKYEESFSKAKDSIKKASEAKIMAEIILKVDFDSRLDDEENNDGDTTSADSDFHNEKNDKDSNKDEEDRDEENESSHKNEKNSHENSNNQDVDKNS